MCSHLCQNILRFFEIKSNAMFVACAIVNTPHDEFSICCITFVYVYNKFTFISLHNNWIVLLGNFFVIDMCESYIVQCKLGVNMFMNMCWRHFLTQVHSFPMITYVCCSYCTDCNFSTYNICITLPRCWSFSHPFGSRRIFSSTFVN